MRPTNHRPAVRVALTLGAVAVVGLIGSASVSRADATFAAGLPGAPERIHLAQADAAPAGTPVSFAPDQADRGETRYMRECEECHGSDLRGGLNGGPPLRGLAFEQKFADGLPASVLFGFTSTAMPPNAPGRFSPSIYADMVAFILKNNGFRTGAPLPSDLDALDQLIMVK